MLLSILPGCRIDSVKNGGSGKGFIEVLECLPGVRLVGFSDVFSVDGCYVGKPVDNIGAVEDRMGDVVALNCKGAQVLHRF